MHTRCSIPTSTAPAAGTFQPERQQLRAVGFHSGRRRARCDRHSTRGAAADVSRSRPRASCAWPQRVCPVSATLGRNSARNDTRAALGGSRGVHVETALTIKRPVSDVYAFWRRFENLPSFMRHLESVTDLGGGRSHWVARGPIGTKVEWDAEIINEELNRLIAWRSLENADVVSAGSVQFRGAPRGRGTELRVKLQYEPPAGKAGAWVAWLLGEEPSRQIPDDLRRVKELLETGEVANPGADRGSNATHGSRSRGASSISSSGMTPGSDARPSPSPDLYRGEPF